MIRRIPADSGGAYGSPRVAAELRRQGQHGHRPATPDLVQHHLPKLRRIRNRHPCTFQLATPPLSQDETENRWTHQAGQETGSGQ
ncbi:hypothetical protein [Candidatus Poriferisocius sp.]|uniref:hypothetical protein n=1 Tax=Candidatus Poriferisocius sp. TaxID=3101276 RepID=UPI003B0297E9